MPFLDNFRLADDPEGTRAFACTTITTTLGIFDSAFLKSRLFFSPLSSGKQSDVDWLRDYNHLFRRASGLGAAESFLDDFFRPRWRFEVSVFDLFGVGRGQGIHQTVEWNKVADICTLDRLLHTVIARDQDRVGAAHRREVPGGVSFPTPFGEPLFESLAAGKHHGKRFRVFSAGDSCEMTEKEREIYLLDVE